MKSFLKRKLRVEFILSDEDFKQNGGINGSKDGDKTKKAISLTNLAVNSSIHRTAGAATAEVYIYGLSRQLMSRLTVLNAFGVANVYQKNVIRLFVQEEIGEFQLFGGVITYAAADFNQQPNVPFLVVASELAELKLKFKETRTIEDGTSIDGAIQSICKEVSLNYQNPYNYKFNMPVTVLTGTAFDQIKKICTTAGCDLFIINEKTIVISPKTLAMSDEEIVKAVKRNINRTNGMIGYPRVTNAGFTAQSLFRHDLNPPEMIMLEVPEMDINVPCSIQSMEHQLNSEMSGGWTTTFQLTRTWKGV